MGRKYCYICVLCRWYRNTIWCCNSHSVSIVCIGSDQTDSACEMCDAKLFLVSFYSLQIAQISHISHFIMLLSSLRLLMSLVWCCAPFSQIFFFFFLCFSLQLFVCFVRLLNSFINISFYCWRLWVFVWLDWMRMRNEKLPMINTRSFLFFSYFFCVSRSSAIVVVFVVFVVFYVPHEPNVLVFFLTKAAFAIGSVRRIYLWPVAR